MAVYMAGAIGRVASREIIEQTAKDAAREIGEAAVRAAVKDASKEVIEAATKAAIKAAFETAAKGASKEVIEAAAREAAIKTAKEFTETAAKEAVATSAKSSLQQAGKQTAGDASTASRSWVAQNPKLVIGGVTAATLAGVAYTKFLKANNRVLHITKIESAGTGKAIITYKETQVITTNDKVTISGSNSVPVIDGTYMVDSAQSNTQITISGASITTSGNAGTLILRTTFDSQLFNTLKDVGTTAGSALSGAVTGAGQGAAKALGFDPNILKQIGIGVGILIVIFLIIKAGLMLRR